MDFGQLIREVGLWPASTIVLLWYVARTHRETLTKIETTCKERLAEKDNRIATLETEARDALRAKDAEKEEWRRLATNRASPRR